MTKAEIKSFLQTKPGFQKKGKEFLSRKFNTSTDTITSVLKEIKEKGVSKYSKQEKMPVMASNELIKQNKSSKHGKEKQSKTKRQKDVLTGMHIVSGCWHFPFHNKSMYKGICDLITDLGTKVKGFHLLGDVLDLNSLSKHSPGQLPLQGVSLGMEYNEGNKALDGFDEVLPKNIQKTYLFGNHEDRFFRHIKDVDASKYSDALPSPTQALRLKERGYKVKDNWKEDYFMLGKHLQLIHGEYCTKSPARTHMDKMKTSVMFVHTHRMDVVYDGEKAGFNIGWGGDIKSPAFSYVSRITKMNWINGFAVVHIDKEGFFHTQVIQVYKGNFWFNGKKYGL